MCPHCSAERGRVQGVLVNWSFIPSHSLRQWYFGVFMSSGFRKPLRRRNKRASKFAPPIKTYFSSPCFFSSRKSFICSRYTVSLLLERNPSCDKRSDPSRKRRCVLLIARVRFRCISFWKSSAESVPADFSCRGIFMELS